MSSDEDTLKLCNNCGNIMMIQGKENTALYVCIICKYNEPIHATTLINFETKTKKSFNIINPRMMHEVYSPLNAALYRKCENKNCKSNKTAEKISLFRKVIYNNGMIQYFCQEC